MATITGRGFVDDGSEDLIITGDCYTEDLYADTTTSSAISGSLTTLATGDPYIIGLGSVTVTTNSLGQVIVSGSNAATGDVNATRSAQFNGFDAVGIGTVRATSLTGSLTRLASGVPYIVALGGVAATTGSNGQVILSSSTAGNVSATQAAQLNGFGMAGVGGVTLQGAVPSNTRLTLSTNGTDAFFTDASGNKVQLTAGGSPAASGSSSNATSMLGTPLQSASLSTGFVTPVLSGTQWVGLSFGETVIDVRSAPFNATGDGTNDDGAAIQAALLTAYSASSPIQPITVYVPRCPSNSGWVFRRPLVIPVNHNIKFVGDAGPPGALSANGTFSILRSSSQWLGDMIVCSPVAIIPSIAADAQGFYELTFNGDGNDPQLNLSENIVGCIHTLPSMSIELFIRPTSGSAFGNPIFSSMGGRGSSTYASVGVARKNGFFLNMGGSNQPMVTLTTVSGTYQIQSSLPITQSVRTKVEASYDGSKLRLYVSGCYAGGINATGSIVMDYHSNLVLGAQPGYWEPIDANVQAQQCSVSSIAFRASAKHTSEGTGIGSLVYPPETVQLTGSTDTLLLLNFNSSASIGGYTFMLGQSWTTVIQSLFVTNGTPSYYQWRGGSQGPQSSAPLEIGGFSVQNPLGSGIDITLCPNSYVRDVTIFGLTRGLTYRNNCYLSRFDNVVTKINPSSHMPGYTDIGCVGECWGIGKIGACGIGGNGRLQGTVVGGYVIVDVNASGGEWELVYARAGQAGGLGSPGFVYAGSAAGQDQVKFTGPYFTDEGGNLSRDVAFYMWNCLQVEFDGGALQAPSLTTGSILFLDGCGDVRINSPFWGAGTGNKSNVGFARGDVNRLVPVPVQVLAYNQNTTLGPGSPWLGTDATRHGVVSIPMLEDATSYIMISGSSGSLTPGLGTRAMTMNEFFSGSIVEVADPYTLLTGSLALNLPVWFRGYEREFFNTTSFTLIVNSTGSTGQAFTVSPGSSSIARSTGTGWRKVTYA